jgi:hypothetical protein
VKTCLALVSCLLLAVGCKTDKAESRSADQPTSTESSRPGRSGKIDLRMQKRPSGSGDRPALDAEEQRDDARGDWEGNREQRRKERQERLDTNHDGKVSPEEMVAARKVRAEETRARLDTDGDGKVTPAELGESRLARRLGDTAALDTDKNGDISVQELEASMEQMRDRMRERMGNRPGGDWDRPGSGADSGSATTPPAP